MSGVSRPYAGQKPIRKLQGQVVHGQVQGQGQTFSRAWKVDTSAGGRCSPGARRPARRATSDPHQTSAPTPIALAVGTALGATIVQSMSRMPRTRGIHCVT